MGRRHSIAEARSNLPRLIREAEAGEAIELTRHGEPVAVLVGRKEYERLASDRRSFSEALDEFLRETQGTDLAVDPDEVFAGIRDENPGRDVDL